MSAPQPSPHHHYVIAFTLATALVHAVAGLLRHRSGVQRLLRLGGDLGAAIVPRVLALLTFASGALLLFSGATPAVGHRLEWVYHYLPIPVVELTHFLDTLIGAGLLILARGIERRLDAAYHLVLVALLAGIVFSLSRAFDYEQALMLALFFVLFLPARKYFTRKTSLIEERFSLRWTAAVSLVVLASLALGVISYQSLQIRLDVLYSAQSQQARFLRSTVGVLGVLIFLALWRLIRPAGIAHRNASPTDIADVKRIISQSPIASAQLGLLGDKYFLFSETRKSFVMYGVSGRSLISLGDPIGPVSDMPALVDAFIEHALRLGLFPVFYKAHPFMLYLYLDYGLAVVKLGEVARVALEKFSLTGSDRRNLRQLWRKNVEAGCSFEVLQPEKLPDLLPQLRAVSNQWLKLKKGREKGFSLGFFNDEYVIQHPIAVAWKDSRIIAFANIWQSGMHDELEADLMRYGNDAPPGVMRYLLAEMMLWGKENGYKWFNLGTAPLSGMRTAAAAPVWHILANAVRGYGERFYNFQGTRDFKERFHPEWEPRFLVSPGGTARPVVLANIARLIAKGADGIISR